VYVKVEWQQTEQELHTLFQQERDGKLRQRYQALWLVREGRSTEDEIAHLVGTTPGTIIRWLNWYRTGGLAEVQAHRQGVHGGVVAKVTLEDQAILAAYAADGAFRSIAEARQWVEDTCGVTYTYWGARSLLDRLKIHAKVPRPFNPKVDPDAQEAWKKGA